MLRVGLQGDKLCRAVLCPGLHVLELLLERVGDL